MLKGRSATRSLFLERLEKRDLLTTFQLAPGSAVKVIDDGGLASAESNAVRLTDDVEIQLAHNESGNATSLSPDGRTLGYSDLGGQWKLLDLETGDVRLGPFAGFQLYFYDNEPVEVKRVSGEWVVRGFDSKDVILTLPNLTVPGETWHDWRIIATGNNEIKDWIWLERRNSTSNDYHMLRANLFTGTKEIRLPREVTGEQNPLRAAYRPHETFWDREKLYLAHARSGPGFTEADWDRTFWEVSLDGPSVPRPNWSHPTIVDRQYAYNFYDEVNNEFEIRFSHNRPSIRMPGFGEVRDQSLREITNHHHLLDGYLISSVEIVTPEGLLHQTGVRVFDPQNRPIAFWYQEHQSGQGFSSANARPFLGWTSAGMTAFWHSDIDNLVGSVDLYSAELLGVLDLNVLPTNDLVAYWDFDDSYADGAPAGSQSDDALPGGTDLVSIGLGATGVEFDAVGDLISVPTSADIDSVDAVAKSVSFWFAPDDSSVGPQVLYQEGDATAGINIYLDEGQLFAGAWDTTQAIPWAGTWLSSLNVLDDQWNHVTFVYDSTDADNGLALYLGRDEVVNAATVPLLFAHSATTTFGNVLAPVRFDDGLGGSVVSNATNDYLGRIEDVRIFDRALTGEEAAALGTAMPTIVPDIFNGLVSFWNFDAGAEDVAFVGAQADDGSISDAFLIGGGWDTRSLQIGTGGMNIPSSPDINESSNQNYSVALWFYPENGTSPDRQVLYEQGDTTTGLNIYLENGQLYAGAWNDSVGWDGTWLASADLVNNAWNHVSFTIDTTDAASGMSLYLNGVAAPTGPTMSLEAHPAASAGWMQGGTRYEGASGVVDNTNSVDNFVGYIDELRIYNRTLSATDAQLLASHILDPPQPLLGFALSVPEFSGNTLTVDEGAGASHQGTLAGPHFDTATLTASFGTITNNLDGTWDWTYVDPLDTTDSRSVLITVVSDGGETAASFELEVDNVAPEIIAVAAAVEPANTLQLNVVPQFVSTDVLSYEIDWGDGIVDQLASQAGSHQYPSGTGTVTAEIRAIDEEGAVATHPFDVVFAESGAMASYTAEIPDLFGMQVDELTSDIVGSVVTDNEDGTFTWELDPVALTTVSQLVTVTARNTSTSAEASVVFALMVNYELPQAVSIRGSHWAVDAHELDALASPTLPWIGMNRFDVVFDQAQTDEPIVSLRRNGEEITLASQTSDNLTYEYDPGVLIDERYELRVNGVLYKFAVLGGDSDGSGNVGFLDFTLFAFRYDPGISKGASPTIADFNGDGFVDFLDFTLFAFRYENELPPETASAQGYVAASFELQDDDENEDAT